jgi:hypothetical protein
MSSDRVKCIILRYFSNSTLTRADWLLPPVWRPSALTCFLQHQTLVYPSLNQSIIKGRILSILKSIEKIEAHGLLEMGSNRIHLATCKPEKKKMGFAKMTWWNLNQSSLLRYTSKVYLVNHFTSKTLIFSEKKTYLKRAEEPKKMKQHCYCYIKLLPSTCYYQRSCSLPKALNLIRWKCKSTLFLYTANPLFIHFKFKKNRSSLSFPNSLAFIRSNPTPPRVQPRFWAQHPPLVDLLSHRRLDYNLHVPIHTHTNCPHNAHKITHTSK